MIKSHHSSGTYQKVMVEDGDYLSDLHLPCIRDFDF